MHNSSFYQTHQHPTTITTTPPCSSQLPTVSALPSSSAQVSTAQAAATAELHKQDEEGGQLSSISVRHMTATEPPPSHPPTHHTHMHQMQVQRTGGCCSFDCSEAQKLSFSATHRPPPSLSQCLFLLITHHICMHAAKEWATMGMGKKDYNNGNHRCYMCI